MTLRKKADLPEKVCLVCGRPFAWRKKWARDWDAVKYCSERCRRACKGGAAATAAPLPDSGRGRRPRP